MVEETVTLSFKNEKPWLRGSIRSTVLEISVTAIFSALVIVTRAFNIPILPAIVVADLAGAFAYVPSSMISFPLTFVFILLNTLTAPVPFLAFFAWVTSIPLVNLASRVAGRHSMWTPLLGPYTGITVFSVISDLLGVKSFLAVFSALVIRATANFITILLLSPIIWKTFERMGQLQEP
jgi:hypothetical protein